MPMNSPYALQNKRVWVAGHRGLVGDALVRRLATEQCEILTVTHVDCDLRHAPAVDAWMTANRPQAVFVAAARVGGIYANDSRPADFIYDNLMIAANVIEAARRTGVEKLLFLGSTCIYPRLAPQPMHEDTLLTGPLEPTNQWYAIAKIAGIKLTQAYRRQHGCDFMSAMPTNLYGIGDNFDLHSSHVLPALIAKAYEAVMHDTPTLEIWGSGRPLREFLHADDCADALVHLMKNYTGEDIVNVGSGQEIAIADLAKLICRIAGFRGHLIFDTTKPDGTPRKRVDVGRLTALGWRPHITLEDGIRETYRWYAGHRRSARRQQLEAV